MGGFVGRPGCIEGPCKSTKLLETRSIVEARTILDGRSTDIGCLAFLRFEAAGATCKGAGEGIVSGATSKSPQPSSSPVSSLLICCMFAKEFVAMDAGRVLGAGAGEGWGCHEYRNCWLPAAFAAEGFEIDPKENGVDVDWVEGGFDRACCGGGCEASSKAAKRSADMFEET